MGGSIQTFRNIVCVLVVLITFGAGRLVLAETVEELEQTVQELTDEANDLAAEAEELQDAADEAAGRRAALEEALAEAESNLWDIISELEQAENALLTTMDEIETTEAEIKALEETVQKTRAELERAKDLMGKRMAASYKGRRLSLITMILSASTFDEFVNNIYLASKITQADAKAVEAVKELKARLEDEQAALESELAEKEILLARQQDEQRVLEEREEAQRVYIEGLDATVREALLAEQAAQAEASRAAAAEAAARAAAAQAQAAADAEVQRLAEETAAAEAAAEASRSDSQANPSQDAVSPTLPSGGESTDSGHGSLTSSQRNIIISTAFERMNAGARYRSTWGGPDYFGCAGFTQYCYAAAGVTLPRSPDWQQNLFVMCPTQDLLPGDLVFWYNHVAIYVGDGMIIEATSYTGGIRYTQNYAGNGNLYYYGGGYLP